MADPFIGEIRIFPYTFAPRSWAWCNGGLVSISEYSALYAVIGLTFGGDGIQTVGLPNLNGRAPMHQGTGTGLTTRYIGGQYGTSYAYLTESTMPSHNHTARAAQMAPNQDGPSSTAYPSAIIRTTSSGGREPALTFSDPDTNLVQMSDYAMADAGASQAHLNYQPFLGLNFFIALEGTWPSRS